MTRKRIAVLASGGGSNFEALALSCERNEINGDIVLLIYDRRDAYVKQRAQNHNVPAIYLNKYQFGKDMIKLDEAMLALLRENGVDLVVLAGYLSQVGQMTVSAYSNRIINTHPSLIPAFCGMGMHGHHVHEAVVNSGVKLSGCTIHFVDENMDTGPIIMQTSVPVYFSDSPSDVAARVLEQEHTLLPKAVSLFCSDRLAVRSNRVEIL